MTLQFDIARYVSLVEAFERTGQAMFPDEWCGLEMWSAPVGGMAAIAEQRKRLQAQLSQLDARLAPLYARFTADQPDDELQALQDEMHPLKNARKTADLDLKGLPIVQPYQLEHEARYERRRTIETTLMAAFEVSDLDLVRAPSELVDWKGWMREGGFVVNFRLGVVRAPVRNSPRRWAPGFVPRAQFTPWVERRAAQPLGDASAPSPEAWIRRQVELRRSKPPKRAAFIHELRERFPELSERKAASLWTNWTPDAWRKPGPKRR